MRRSAGRAVLVDAYRELGEHGMAAAARLLGLEWTGEDERPRPPRDPKSGRVGGGTEEAQLPAPLAPYRDVPTPFLIATRYEPSEELSRTPGGDASTEPRVEPLTAPELEPVGSAPAAPASMNRRQSAAISSGRPLRRVG